MDGIKPVSLTQTPFHLKPESNDRETPLEYSEGLKNRELSKEAPDFSITMCISEMLAKTPKSGRYSPPAITETPPNWMILLRASVTKESFSEGRPGVKETGRESPAALTESIPNWMVLLRESQAREK